MIFPGCAHQDALAHHGPQAPQLSGRIRALGRIRGTGVHQILPGTPILPQEPGDTQGRRVQAAGLTARTLRGAYGSSPIRFQLPPWPLAYQKIMEDPGSVETLGVHSPPDLPPSPKLPLKSGLQPDRCLDGQAAAVFTLGMSLWDVPNPPRRPGSSPIIPRLDATLYALASYSPRAPSPQKEKPRP